MANRQGRSVPLSDRFDPKPSLEKDRGAMPYLDGSADATVSAVAEGLAKKFGGYADRAAAIEGKRAGMAAGLDPSFRPSGSTTIRGASFDQAATSVYADRLETQIREQMWGAFSDWQAQPPDAQTPAALDQRLGAVRASFKDSLFPEVAGEFDKRFSALATTMRFHAFQTSQQRMHDQAAAELVTSIDAMANSAQRAATLDPESPAAAAEIAHAQRSIDTAVKEGHISPEAGARLKLRTRDTIAATRYTAPVAAATTPDQVQAQIDKLDKDYKAGDETLSGGVYDRTRAELEVKKRSLEAQGHAGTTLLKTRLKDAVDRAAGGFDIPATEWEVYEKAATTPEAQAELRLAEKKIQVAKASRGLPPEELEKRAALQRGYLKAAGEGATTEQAEVVEFAEKLARDAREERTRDPLLFGARTVNVPLTTLDFQGDPGALVGALKQRAADAKAIAASTHGPVKFFRPDEVSALIDTANEGGDRTLAVAQALVNGLGADAPRALSELNNRAPSIVKLGQLLASGAPSSRQFARDVAEAIKMKRVPGAQLPQPKGNMPGTVYNETVGAALLSHGEEQQRVRAAALEAWQARLTRLGKTPDDPDADKMFAEALQEAAGGSTVNGEEYGGVGDYKTEGWWGFRSDAKVPVPPNVKRGHLADLLEALKDSDFDAINAAAGAGASAGVPVDENGVRLPIKTLRKAVPVYTAQGYRFAMGDPSGRDPKYLRSSNGGIFTLNLQALEPILRRRVRGVYLGD